MLRDRIKKYAGKETFMEREQLTELFSIRKCNDQQLRAVIEKYPHA